MWILVIETLPGKYCVVLIYFFSSCFWNFCSVADFSRGLLVKREEIQTVGAVETHPEGAQMV